MWVSNIEKTTRGIFVSATPNFVGAFQPSYVYSKITKKINLNSKTCPRLTMQNNVLKKIFAMLKQLQFKLSTKN